MTATSATPIHSPSTSSEQVEQLNSATFITNFLKASLKRTTFTTTLTKLQFPSKLHFSTLFQVLAASKYYEPLLIDTRTCLPLSEGVLSQKVIQSPMTKRQAAQKFVSVSMQHSNKRGYIDSPRQYAFPQSQLKRETYLRYVRTVHNDEWNIYWSIGSKTFWDSHKHYFRDKRWEE